MSPYETRFGDETSALRTGRARHGSFYILNDALQILPLLSGRYTRTLQITPYTTPSSRSRKVGALPLSIRLQDPP